jgi:hypothetical protein
VSELQDVAESLDQAIVKSRLNSLAVMMMTDRSERLSRITAALAKLRRGAYLIGTGPSTVGIIPLTVEEVVLGRCATPLEVPADTVVDYEVSDAMYLGPHEVSKVHAKIVRKETTGGWQYSVCDLGSTCGTFVNGERLGAPDGGQVLSHGDVISLGGSHTSTYLLIIIDPDNGEKQER